MQHEELDIPRFSPRAAPTSSYRTRRQPPEGTRRMLLIAGAIGGGAILLFGGWSLLSRGPAQIPVIQADSRPLRIKPENRGGLQVGGANDDILSGDSVKQADALAAPAEVPQTEQLRELKQAELDREHPATASLAPAPAPAPPPPAAVAPAPPAPPPATPAPPAPAPASATALAARSTPREITPPPVAKPTEAGHAPAGKTAVQLAAVGSEEAARQLWQRMASRMPDLLHGRKPDVTRIDRQGHVFWRLRVDGFADTATADNFCTQVRGKGGGCSVADF